MELFEAIAKRHSYRGAFKEDRPGRDDLRKIVQAGIQAPSGHNKQTTRFVIVDEPGLVEKIQQLHPGNKAMQQGRAYIVCCVDVEADEGLSFEVEDCAAAVENMLLAVTALGYATVWVDGWLRVEGRARTIGDIIGLPKEKIPRVILPLGVPAEEWKQMEKMPFEKRACFNKYDIGCD